MKALLRIPNAKKWTEERVTQELAAIKHDALREDVDCLSVAMVRQDLYIQLWAYWKKIFANNDDIIEQMLIIESIFQARLVQSALRKKISPWIAMFVLKNNYHWSDKPDEEEKNNQNDDMIIRLDEDTVMLPSEQPGRADIYRREVKA